MSSFFKKLVTKKVEFTVCMQVHCVRMPITEDCEVSVVFKRGRQRDESDKVRIFKHLYDEADDSVNMSFNSASFAMNTSKSFNTS